MVYNQLTLLSVIHGILACSEMHITYYLPINMLDQDYAPSCINSSCIGQLGKVLSVLIALTRHMDGQVDGQMDGQMDGQTG